MSETSNRSSIPETLMCERCDVEMTLGPQYEGSQRLGYWCPCCKSFLRTIALLNSDADNAAYELGMTREQYEAHMDEKTKDLFAPVTDADLEHARKFAEHQRETWTPVCPHVENPWA